MSLIQRHGLLAVVFATGAIVLILEVTAIRILAPYFGNTIFAVSSVLGVILAALSVGYYLGGKLSDRRPESGLFFEIILLGGLAVLLLQILKNFLLPILGYKFSVVSGPLVASLVLFFSPAVLLGMLSPFAIKLQSLRLKSEGIGSVSGEVFFCSTLGSIFGSLVAGFLLVPRVGIDAIILWSGVFLIVLGAIPLFRNAGGSKFIWWLMIIAAVVAFFVFFFPADQEARLIFSRDGVYEKLSIYEGMWKGRATRFLAQDRSSSGAMYLDSDELVYDYTKYYALYKVFNPDVRRALFIGGGAYSMPKALWRDIQNVVVDVAEIEPDLFKLAQKYFLVPDDPRLRNHVTDGKRLLYDAGEPYDYIFSDVYYSLYSAPPHFTSREFFRLAKEKLSPDGVFLANFIGSLSRKSPSLVFSEMKTFQDVFPNSYFFAVRSPGTLSVQNIIFAGYKGDRRFSKDDFVEGLKNDALGSVIAEKMIDLDRFEFGNYPVITDDFAPVEYFTAYLLQEESARGKRLIDGEEMMAIIFQQLASGPRFLGSPGHKKVQDFILAEMQALGPDVFVQSWDHKLAAGESVRLKNIIARFSPENPRRIILGTHYDSKRFANRDAENREVPVPGANDSASGVAALVELARILFVSDLRPDVGVDFVFFDGEEGDEGLSEAWYPLGSSYFAEHLTALYQGKKPESAVILDMICDKDLKIRKEASSVAAAPQQVESFWNMAAGLYPEIFMQEKGIAIRDDHTPLNAAGIPSILIIDFEYPFFHTGEDLPDKCSAESLEAVSRSVLQYILSL